MPYKELEVRTQNYLLGNKNNPKRATRDTVFEIVYKFMEVATSEVVLATHKVKHYGKMKNVKEQRTNLCLIDETLLVLIKDEILDHLVLQKMNGYSLICYV